MKIKMNVKMNAKSQQGFTLVEIAIVLVIIGLLLGGSLKGQQMIANAKVKSQIQQIEGIAAAINAYKEAYNALPGDDGNAKANLQVDSLTNGNNGGTFNNLEGDKRIWEHLEAAGLLAGYNPASNGRFMNKYSKQTFVRTNYAGLSGTIVCFSVPNDVAREIDRKVDDNSGKSGNMRRSNQLDYPTSVGSSWICSAA